MGLFDTFKKKTKNKQNNIIDTIDKTSFLQVFSACLGKMMVIQNRAAELIVKNQNWNVDFSQGIIAFGDDIYPIQFLGSESSVSNTWNWGYNNINHFSNDLIDMANKIYEKGVNWNLDALCIAQFEMDDLYNGHNLAIVACGIDETSHFYYRCPHDKGAVFVVVENASKNVFEPVDMHKFLSITMQCIQQFTVDHKTFVEAFLQWNKTSYEWKDDTIIAYFTQKLYISFEPIEDMYRIIAIKSN